jgi:hypothetical protein
MLVKLLPLYCYVRVNIVRKLNNIKGKIGYLVICRGGGLLLGWKTNFPDYLYTIFFKIK